MSSQFKRTENGLYIATKNFSMPKAVKRRLATIANDELRNHWKNTMAQAVMQSFDVPESKKKKVNGKEVVTK